MDNRDQRTPLFVVNVWFYRERATAAEPAVDIYGNRLEIDWIRRNGIRTGVPTTRLACFADADATPSILPELWRRRSATIAQYRNEDRCSVSELRTIVALWEEGKALRQHAREEGCSAQAIESRINSLYQKAPAFYRWWRLKNRTRQYRRRP